ncbi:hypothetical protein RF11_11645 [Thelohanellus kitauei]|uniref:Uncharacterized protein n=1 Tax=Thelohanellus kitauei TaxID=669202 RepID=A0A0C2M849_THEKT|nr:hypothetical protein RF11_11645 [Thelohanellus kitauei]
MKLVLFLNSLIIYLSLQDCLDHKDNSHPVGYIITPLPMKPCHLCICNEEKNWNCTDHGSCDLLNCDTSHPDVLNCCQKFGCKSSRKINVVNSNKMKTLSKIMIPLLLVICVVLWLLPRYCRAGQRHLIAKKFVDLFIKGRDNFRKRDPTEDLGADQSKPNVEHLSVNKLVPDSKRSDSFNEKIIEISAL